MNILLITLDQFRGGSMSCAGHPVVRTPHLDALAAAGVRFGRHYSQASPCAPGRACLYTGTYQMNNRVVGNGTPLDHRFDNVARAGRRAGYQPALFGYTDAGMDPRRASGPDDPWLSTYEGVLPGFDAELDLRGPADPWMAWLESLGYDVAAGAHRMLATEGDRPEEHSITAYTVDRFLAWTERQERAWFAHLSILRPHPPYAAAGQWSRAYQPADMPPPIPVPRSPHPLVAGALALPVAAAPTDPEAMARLQAQYFGMIGHVDHQLGRLWEGLRDAGAWDETVVVVTSDHGEQLGDHGLVQKLGFYESSYHIPAIIRDPRRPAAHGTTVDRFTENVDMLPTLCELMDLPVPPQCDGMPLTPFLDGKEPPWWRTAAHWEYDWRTLRPDRLEAAVETWPWDRRLERQNLAVVRDEETAYVQFGNGSWLCFDLAVDDTWHTQTADPARVLASAQEMLTWRAQHTDRNLTGFLLEGGGMGRRPAEVPAP